MNEAIEIYCCTKCGKWSHAKRKPKFHKRYHRMYTQWGMADDEPPAELIIEVVEGYVDYASGEGDDGGWIVRCGPFDTYRAELVT